MRTGLPWSSSATIVLHCYWASATRTPIPSIIAVLSRTHRPAHIAKTPILGRELVILFLHERACGIARVMIYPGCAA